MHYLRRSPGVSSLFSLAILAGCLIAPVLRAAPFTRDIGSFLQLGASAGAQSPAGSYATNQIDNVTLEIWVLLADTTGAHHAFFNGNGGSSGYGLYLSGGTVNILMGSVGWIVCSTGATYNAANAAVLVAGRWTHIAATRNSADGGTDGWRIYVDGQPLATQFNAAGGATGVPLPLNALSYVQIGSAAFDPAGLSVSEARIWTRALTQAEIQANMSGTVATDALDLAGYWKLAQATGSTVTDLQTNKSVLNLPISGPVTWIASTSGFTAEDTPLVGQLAGGDLTATVTYTTATDPGHGSVTITVAGAYTYTPAANFTGSDTFSFKVNNGTEDSGARAVNVTVTAVNDGPTIGGAVSNQAVNDTATISPFSILTIADPDSNVTASVALDTAAKGVFTAASLTASGFSTSDGGATYTHAEATPAAMQAAIRALVFDPTDNRVASGSTETTTFTVSVNDGVAAPVTNSTTTVVSTSVNDAPLLGAGTYAYSGTDENSTSASVRIQNMFGAMGYTDVDFGSVTGIAVTVATANGTWQYSTDGSTGWTNFGTVDVSSALLLTSGTYVRFVPDNRNGETATFTFRAWDRTVDLASYADNPRYANTTTNGGTSQFSTTQASASITVSSVNDAPGFVGAVTSLTVNENTGGTSVKALLHASDPDNAQTLTWTESAAPAHGTLAFSDATAASPGTDIMPGGTITYTPTANYVGSDTFTVQVSDGAASATRTIVVTVNVVATELRFTTQPSGSVSGTALAGQPVVKATDAAGNVDPAFTGNVTLSLGSGAGSLSGTLVQGAIAGVATFTDLTYTATADQQSFTLTTANTAGLTEATSSAATSDVVATKLRFATQPAPLTMASTVTRTFTTPPVVQAVDAANVMDTGYSTAIVLSLTKSDGSAAAGTVNSVAGTGDTDGSGTTVTLDPTSGAATFSGLSVRYANSAATDSLALHASSGGLTAANSTALSSRVDTPPMVDTLTTGGTFTEGGAAVVVSSSVTVTDADDVACAWATVSIVQNFTAGQDVLSFTNNGTTMGNIAAVYDAGTGVLTLTSAGASATRAQWASALGAVKYANTSDAPNTANRQMLFVINDGYLSSDSGYAFAKTNVTVAGTNDAPTLSGGPFALDPTDENAMSSATAVSTILAGLTYADPDGSVAAGIAITQKSGASSWAYSTDGITWAAMGTVSNTSALLLTSTSWVRYLPNGVDGETATLTFRAWDQTAGTASMNSARGLADPSTNGGTTAFSTGTAQATLTVTSVNDAPTLSGGPATLTGTDEDTLSSSTLVSAVLAGLTYADPDAGAASGIAITATNGTGGWQYSTDGVAWSAVGTVSNTSALLLTSTSRIRYAPVGAGGETAAITFRGWDQTSGTASTNSTRGLADASVNGGTTAFSTGTAQATMTVTAVEDPPPAKDAQTITFGALADAVLGQTVMLSASASSGLPVTFAIASGPATLSGSALTCTGIGVVTVRAAQPGSSLYDPAPAVERSFSVGLPTPAPVSAPVVGGTATLTAPSGMTGASYRWQRNGADVANATTATLMLADTQPPTAGLYTYTVTPAGGTATTSEPMIVGLSTTDKVVGAGASAGADIRHPNGNTYDQLLLEGSGASFTADPAQVTRMSFVDLSDDIVQVEFSGAGTLSLVMDNASAGAPAANYNQPGVNYVRGNVGIVITGANETTNVCVFSVGRITAVNQSLFREGVAYDGVANVAFIAIQSANGKFGGLRTGNVEYFAANGFTGVYAPGVQFTGPLYVGDIQAYDNARPVLVVGSASDVRVTGGSLAQPNGQPVSVTGLTQVQFTNGRTSQGDTLPGQVNQAVLQQGGVDVTDLIVIGP